MKPRLFVEVAMEWFLASGDRTEARLRGLVEHHARTYAITDPEEVAAGVQSAIEMVGPSRMAA